MKREDLIKVIDLLDNENDKENEAYFGIYYLGDYTETFVKANKKGVINFTKELLDILHDFDFHLSKKDHYATINFKKGKWFDEKAPINLGWIEPLDKTREEIVKENDDYFIDKRRWYHKLSEFVINGLIRVFMIIGFIQSLIWIYNWIF